MKRGNTLNSFLVFKYRLRSTINTIFEFLRTVARETSLNMPKELLEALMTDAGQTSLNMPN
jgi:hypothetical protein